MDEKTKLMFGIENKILDIVDNKDEFTRGDLQGAIEAQIMICIQKAQEIITRDKWEKVGFKNDWGLVR